MSLTDVMSGAGLTGYAEVGLVISVVTFVAIAIWVFLRPREEMEANARSVFDEEPARITSGQHKGERSTES